MSVILVVERDASYAESISEALRSDGLSVETARSAAEALSRADAVAPQLVLASASLPRAEELFAAFSRRRGGPGAVALVPAAEATRVSAADFQADEVLAKPFSEDALRELVQRCMRPASGREAPSDDDEQLTSADIFGELLAEVEVEARKAKPAPRKPGPMTDVERKLEETLSGVIPVAGKPGAPRKKRRIEPPTEAEIDKLLDQTLSSLDISTRRRRTSPERRPPERRPPERRPPEIEPLDFEPPELELEPIGEPEPVEPPPAAPAPAAPALAAAADLDKLRPDHFRTQALPLDLTKELADGEPFGDYTLLDRIAIGGMAEVWRARRRGVEGFQKTVAIKKILSHLTGSSDFVTMFIDEAKLAAQLTHNNIIQIYDLGKVGDDFFIAMEHVDGKDLRSILTAAQQSGKPIPVGLGLFIVKAVARALDYAHRKRDFDNRALGLVHRDVSPQNVLISWEGEIKLCDFGIVKAVAKASTTQMGALKGKLQYMSPEQAWGKNVDARSDIFSLGSVLFEVLTGSQLFEADTEIGVLDAVRECRIRPARELVPEIPEGVDQTLEKALAQTPEARFQTADELEHELQAALDDMRPAPSQKDLAAYLRSLFPASPAAAPPVAAPLAAPRAAAEAEAALADSAPAEAPPAVPARSALEAESPEPAPEAEVPEPAPEAEVPEPALEAESPEPALEAEVPEAGAPEAPPAASDDGAEVVGTGRGRGLKWLLAAVVAGALIAAGLLLLRPDQEAATATAPAAVEDAPPATPAAIEDTSPAAQPAAIDGETAAEVAGGQEDTVATSLAATTGIDIEQLVTEELNSRAERLRQDFEAEKKRLEEELAKTRTVEPPPADETQEEAGGDGGSGSGS